MTKNTVLSLLIATALVACGDSNEEKKVTAAPTAQEIAKQKEVAKKEAAEAKEEATETLEEAREAFEKKDYEEALELAKEAGDKGNLPEAQYLVGSMYFNGLGTDVDYVESYTWTTLSNIYKVKGSRELLNRTYRKLTPEQLKESKAKVKAFLAAHKS